MADVGLGFFPTGREVFSGIKWLKEHPMVATAAAVGATAISVVTFLRTTTKPQHDKAKHIVDWCDTHVKEDAARPQMATNEEEDLLNQEIQSAMDNEVVKKEAVKNECGGMDTPALHSASPQWGWYVAITPPTDLVGQGLPRAITDPMQIAPPSVSNMSLRRSQSVRLR